MASLESNIDFYKTGDGNVDVFEARLCVLAASVCLERAGPSWFWVCFCRVMLSRTSICLSRMRPPRRR